MSIVFEELVLANVELLYPTWMSHNMGHTHSRHRIIQTEPSAVGNRATRSCSKKDQQRQLYIAVENKATLQTKAQWGR